MQAQTTDDELDDRQSNGSKLPNAFLKKQGPQKPEKRNKFQDIIGNLNKQVKKAQLSFVNTRHFSLPQQAKNKSTVSDGASKGRMDEINLLEKFESQKNNGYNVPDGMPKWKDTFKKKNVADKTNGISLTRRSGADSMKTLKKVHQQLG